jgi:hypothetical protein
MHVQTAGATMRPTLALDFGGRAERAATGERRSPTLSVQDLRRLVAAMID